MCYFTSKPYESALKDFFISVAYNIEEWQLGAYFPANIESGFSHKLMAVTTTEKPHAVGTAIWGLVPHWARTSEEAKQIADMTLNAVGEEIFNKPSYKNYIGSNRCLVWVDGFYEWQHLEYKVPGKGSRMRTEKEKRTHFIYMPGQQPFALGGVYSLWERPDNGHIYHTVSIITTAANTLMAEIHNSKKRMPFIVQRDDWEHWLSPMQREEIQAMIRPLPDGILQAHPVMKVNPRDLEQYNNPQVKEPYAYPDRALF